MCFIGYAARAAGCWQPGYLNVIRVVSLVTRGPPYCDACAAILYRFAPLVTKVKRNLIA